MKIKRFKQDNNNLQKIREFASDFCNVLYKCIWFLLCYIKMLLAPVMLYKNAFGSCYDLPAELVDQIEISLNLSKKSFNNLFLWCFLLYVKYIYPLKSPFAVLTSSTRVNWVRAFKTNASGKDVRKKWFFLVHEVIRGCSHHLPARTTRTPARTHLTAWAVQIARCKIKFYLINNKYIILGYYLSTENYCPIFSSAFIIQFLRIYNFFRLIFKIWRKSKIFRKHFLWFINLSLSHVRSNKNLGPIGSAVLTFVGYKQANTHTDK